MSNIQSYGKVQQGINKMTKAISDNYVKMLDTCDHFIERGIDPKGWVDIKLRIIEKKNQVDNSLIPTHE